MSSETAEARHKDHDGREVTIVINGRKVSVRVKELSFEEVVELSGKPTGPNIVFTISYRKGHGSKPEGSMVQGGDPVKVKEGMIFNVDSTDRS